MAIILPVPHNARYVPISQKFTATFSAVNPGKYYFNVAANTNINVLALDKNMVYYIDTLSVGANISGEDYLDCIDILPLLTLRRLIGNENLYQTSIPIVQLFQEKQICKYIHSDKSGDALTLTFSGQLLQNSGLIGLSDVNISVFLSLYGIDDNYFNTAIRDKINPAYSNQLTRG